MMSSDDSTDPHPTKLTSTTFTDFESVMADYIERIENGQSPDPSRYLACYPQFADELKAFFQNHHWFGDSPASDVSDSLVGRTIGRYAIESEIARGGMGVVYRARQSGLDRPVALKLISSGVLASREERRRFRTEAEAAARMQHPGIVAIHEIGSWQGYEFFSMALVEGPTLQQCIDRGDFDDERSVQWMIQIARAVAYAHDAGILHRDLKPDNVLMSSEGLPMLTDFGLAKWHREGTLLTKTGQVLGTPNYMSPEQALGSENIDNTSDVYSLGAILYTLIAGVPPHGSGSTAEVLQSVLQDEPISPRVHRPEISTSIENICRKAIARDSGERYCSANDFADDLQRWVDGEPIAADHSGLFGQVARELRRDQHGRQFVDWSHTLIWIGGIILSAHVTITVLDAMHFPRSIAFWIPRALMFLLLAAVVYRARGGHLTPRTVAERPVYSTWIGYLAALSIANLMTLMEVIPERSLLPITAMLSGFGFLAMSGHVWGGTAIFGGLFMLVSLVLPFAGILSPLVFGIAWFATLAVLSSHYRQN